MKENKGNHQEKNNAGGPLPEAHKPAGGQRVLSIVISVFTCVVAVPVFLISFIKSPSPLQDVHTFGISYYNLVFIFLISAVGLIFSVLFFVRFRLFVNLAILILSLFCCVPLIMGLKNDLTLHQAILNAPFFSNWPFFLRPLYILIEFLLPMGILIFLFLQLKNIFSRRPHSYIFLGASVYLAAAAFIGFSGLLQAGEPTIITALSRHDGSFMAPDSHHTALQQLSGSRAESGEKIRSSGALPSDLRDEMTDQPENVLGQSNVPVEDSKRELLDRKVGSLEGKIDRISKELEQMNSSLTGEVHSANTPLESLPPATPHGVELSKENELAQIDYRLALLSDKINQMAETLEQLKKPAVEHRQSAMVDVRQKVELLTIKLDQLLSRLNQSEYFITQQQSPTKRGEAQSSTTNDHDISSSELAGVLHKIELLSDKVDLVSEMLLEKGMSNREGR